MYLVIPSGIGLFLLVAPLTSCTESGHGIVVSGGHWDWMRRFCSVIFGFVAAFSLRGAFSFCWAQWGERVVRSQVFHLLGGDIGFSGCISHILAMLNKVVGKKQKIGFLLEIFCLTNNEGKKIMKLLAFKNASIHSL